MVSDPKSLVVTFPTAWGPLVSNRIIRLGHDYDGGYLVDERDVMAADALISMGIASDWSFEKDFAKRNGVPVVAYDGSISALKFLYGFIRSLFQINRPKRMFERYSLWRDYLTFFQGQNRHELFFVGGSSGGRWITFTEALRSAQSKGHAAVFLKIDIEGSEYDILDDLVEYAEKTSALVIEFHDVEARAETITQFVKKYPLSLIHLHVNNISTPGSETDPLAIEMTFSSSEPGDGLSELPHRLDRPNNGNLDDYVVRFAG